MTAQPITTGAYGHAIIAGLTDDLDRDAWVAGRRQYLGASEIAAILCWVDSDDDSGDGTDVPEALNAYRGPWDVWAVKTGLKESFAGNEFTAIGNLVEPHLRRWASEAIGAPVEAALALLQHPKAPRFATNLDGWAPSLGVPVELKWGSWRARDQWVKWSEWLAADESHTTAEPPTVCQGQSLMAYWCQVQAQLSITGAPYGYLCGVMGESALRLLAGYPPASGDQFVFKVLPDAEFCEVLPGYVERWWTEHVEGGVAPTPSRQDYEAIREAYRQSIAGKSVLAPDLARHVESYRDAQDEMKALKRVQEAAKAAICAAMGDAEVAIVPGHKDVTWKPRKDGVRVCRIA